MVDFWELNINVVWKTTIVSLSVCRAFFSYNLYLRDKSRAFFAHRTISCKKYWHKQFFLKTVDFWELNINVVWKTTIVSLIVWRAFLVIICICVTNHVLFLLAGRYFVKNADISNFFSKRWISGSININVVWKTTIVSLSEWSSFISYNVYLRDKSRSSLAQQGEFLSRNPDISNFFSKGRNAGV